MQSHHVCKQALRLPSQWTGPDRISMIFPIWVIPSHSNMKICIMTLLCLLVSYLISKYSSSIGDSSFKMFPVSIHTICSTASTSFQNCINHPRPLLWAFASLWHILPLTTAIRLCERTSKSVVHGIAVMWKRKKNNGCIQKGLGNSGLNEFK